MFLFHFMLPKHNKCQLAGVARFIHWLSLELMGEHRVDGGVHRMALFVRGAGRGSAPPLRRV